MFFDVPAVFFFSLGAGSYSEVPAIHYFSVWAGTSCSDTPAAVSFFPLRGGVVFLYFYILAASFFPLGRDRVPMSPAYPLFRWGGGIVFRCSHGFPFYVGEGHRILMFSRHPFFHWGVKVYFDVVLAEFPLLLGGRRRIPMS